MKTFTVAGRDKFGKPAVYRVRSEDYETAAMLVLEELVTQGSEYKVILTNVNGESDEA